MRCRNSKMKRKKKSTSLGTSSHSTSSGNPGNYVHRLATWSELALKTQSSTDLSSNVEALSVAAPTPSTWLSLPAGLLESSGGGGSLCSPSTGNCPHPPFPANEDRVGEGPRAGEGQRTWISALLSSTQGHAGGGLPEMQAPP